MKVCVLSANLGSYDLEVPWAPQIVGPGITVDVHRFTDANFPPRPKAMTSALQCGILKWFGWEFVPDADVCVWIDASCAPTPQAVTWFLEQLGHADLAVFAHPDRRTVREEYEFMKARMARPGERYLTSRYAGEWLDDEFKHCDPSARLVASTAFIYVPFHQGVRDVFRKVWEHKTKFCLHDQLAFSSVLVNHSSATLRVNWIPDSYLNCPALVYMRNKRKRENVAR